MEWRGGKERKKLVRRRTKTDPETHARCRVHSGLAIRNGLLTGLSASLSSFAFDSLSLFLTHILTDNSTIQPRAKVRLVYCNATHQSALEDRYRSDRLGTQVDFFSYRIDASYTGNFDIWNAHFCVYIYRYILKDLIMLSRKSMVSVIRTSFSSIFSTYSNALVSDRQCTTTIFSQ